MTSQNDPKEDKKSKSTKINIDLPAMVLEKSIGEEDEIISDSDLKNIRIIADIPSLIRQTKNPKIDASIDPEVGPKDSRCVEICPMIFKPYGCGRDQMMRFELLEESNQLSSPVNELLEELNANLHLFPRNSTHNFIMVLPTLIIALTILTLYFIDEDLENVNVYVLIALIGLMFASIPLPFYFAILKAKRVKNPIKKWNNKYKEQKLVAVMNSYMEKMISLCNCDKRSYKWYPKVALQIHALNSSSHDVLNQYDVYM